MPGDERREFAPPIGGGAKKSVERAFGLFFSGLLIGTSAGPRLASVWQTQLPQTVGLRDAGYLHKGLIYSREVAGLALPKEERPLSQAGQ